MQFKALYTAVITPFDRLAREIDYDAYEKIIRYQIAAGVEGVVPCGTTGESPTLSHEEHRELIKRTVKHADGKIKVLAGTGSNSTAEAIELTQAACSDGVDAVMLVNPYYNKPTQEGLYQHFCKVADHSTVPVVLYNIQGRTAVNIKVETLKRLSQHKRISAVKEASGDIFQMVQMQKACSEQLALLCGDDNITPAFMGLGGRGIISVASNLYPKKMSRMMALYMQGDFRQANEIFYSLVDLMNALFWETNPIPLKAAAEIVGLCEDSLRLPLTTLNRAKKEDLAAIIRQVGTDS